MAFVRPENEHRRVIDCRGPEGNAFALMGQAQAFAKQLEYTAEQRKAMIDDMMSGDYNHLLKVFDNYFGSFCDLIIPDAVSDDEFDD